MKLFVTCAPPIMVVRSESQRTGGEEVPRTGDAKSVSSGIGLEKLMVIDVEKV